MLIDTTIMNSFINMEFNLQHFDFAIIIYLKCFEASGGYNPILKRLQFSIKTNKKSENFFFFIRYLPVKCIYAKHEMKKCVQHVWHLPDDRVMCTATSRPDHQCPVQWQQVCRPFWRPIHRVSQLYYHIMLWHKVSKKEKKKPKKNMNKEIKGKVNKAN